MAWPRCFRYLVRPANDDFEGAYFDQQSMHDGIGAILVADPPELLSRKRWVLDSEGVWHGANTVYAYSIEGADGSVNADIADVAQTAPAAP